MKVELSGGIRDDASLAAALATGCRRVNLGTAALENPEWVAKIIAEHGDQIAVGLDVRGTTLRGRGWTREGGDLWEMLDRLEADGCPRYVVTDVTKDGTLQGPNLDLLREVCAATDRPVVASGGVSSLDDLRAIAVPRAPGRGGRDRGQGAVRRGIHAGRSLGDGDGMISRMARAEPAAPGRRPSAIARASSRATGSSSPARRPSGTVLSGEGDPYGQAKTAFGIALGPAARAGSATSPWSAPGSTSSTARLGRGGPGPQRSVRRGASGGTMLGWPGSSTRGCWSRSRSRLPRSRAA